MKHFIVFILLGFSLFASAQDDRITFSYDNAGNQITRSLCLQCTTSKNSPKPKEIIALKEEDLQKFFPEDVISYYPNPVKEELYLKWELIEGNLVTSIQVYGLSGQLLKSYSGLETNNAQNIPFQAYPSGVYAVVLFYSNGEQKSIKIIKQ
nr:T9SS type A sorting domain-containing protein [uncultured Flavobacterium sp.]